MLKLIKMYLLKS